LAVTPVDEFFGILFLWQANLNFSPRYLTHFDITAIWQSKCNTVQIDMYIMYTQYFTILIQIRFEHIAQVIHKTL
jgi:hypothetical protein